MKFSIIGTGFIFPTHVAAIRDVGGEIIDVVNDARGPDVWREMVKSTSAGCIVILTPNDLHFQMAEAAAAEGKIVLCEKPLCIKSEDVKTLAGKPNIFTVLQLRCHPLVQKLKEKIPEHKKHEVDIDISVYRDQKYYASWKGQKERSGGILFNLGIHYFDLLVYLFGEAVKVSTSFLDEKTGTGTIEGINFACRWRISTGETKENQRRIFKINGISYNFSSRNNLAYENLHGYVYHDLLFSRGVTPKEEFHSIQLVEKLYQGAGFELSSNLEAKK